MSYQGLLNFPRKRLNDDKQSNWMLQCTRINYC